jgi:hypothetical protein
LECDEDGDDGWKDADQKLMDFWDRTEEDSARFLESLIWDESEDEEESIEPRPKRVRTSKKVQFFRYNEQGERVSMTPLESTWYTLYVVSPNLEEEKFHQKFRLRFRMPYPCFVDLLEMVKTKYDEDNGELYFRRWMSRDATGSLSSPIELMLLGSLRYLGRGGRLMILRKQHASTWRLTANSSRNLLNLAATCYFQCSS